MDPVKPGDIERILESYLNEAKKVFATRDGYERWEPVYVSIPTKIGAHVEKIRSRKNREYFYNLNLITMMISMLALQVAQRRKERMGTCFGRDRGKD